VKGGEVIGMNIRRGNYERGNLSGIVRITDSPSGSLWVGQVKAR
jgi:hypothetical protein